MKKIIFMGRSGAGKTTLMQAIKGEELSYHKTQYISYEECIIDTPGEYAQTHGLGAALALYSYEADVVGLLLSATEPYCLYPPCITNMVNRDVIGIITHARSPKARLEWATRCLKGAGCKTIFLVEEDTGEGVEAIMEYLGYPPGYREKIRENSEQNQQKIKESKEIKREKRD